MAALVNPDDPSWNPPTGAVIEWLAEAFRYLHGMVQRACTENEPTASVLSVPTDPAGGPAVLIAVLALVLAAAALGTAIRTRLRAPAKVAATSGTGRADR